MIHRSAVLACAVRRKRGAVHEPAVDVGLLQPVFQMDPLGPEALGDRVEVDDDVGPLRDSHTVARDLDRPRKQVAVVGDDEERDLLAQVVGIGQKELVEPRRADVQDAEAVPPPLDLKERPDLAVHQKGIAESSIGVERVEGEQPCRRVEQPVGDH